MSRPTTITEYLRHEFTQDERLQMGNDLAAAYNERERVEDEEAVVKARFKDRKATVEQKINQLSRELSAGFTMQNVECEIRYDDPNPFEVSIYRKDNGKHIKTRPMSDEERQAEIEFDKPVAVNPSAEDLDAVAEEDSIADSTRATKEFFGLQDKTATDQPEPVEAE